MKKYIQGFTNVCLLVVCVYAIIGCKDGIDLSGMKLSTEPHILYKDGSSSLTFDFKGGTGSFSVKNNGTSTHWRINGVPDWLDISQTYGDTDAEIWVSVNPYYTSDEMRTAYLEIVSDELNGYETVEVSQKGIKLLTLAEAETLSEGDIFYSKVICCGADRFPDDKWGAICVTDGRDSLYTWCGVSDEEGNLCYSKYNITIGDEIIFKGIGRGLSRFIPIQIDRSLIKITSTTPADGILTTKGGIYTINLECDGNGFDVEIPDAAKTWLSIESIDTSGRTSVVKLRAKQCNNIIGCGTDIYLRSKSSDGNKSSYTKTVLIEKCDYSVDLALPSGNIWRQMNLGASGFWEYFLACKCDIYGGYYKWGYVYPQEYSTSINDISGTSDDTVKDYLEGDWVMPTKEDYKELIDNCQYEWVDNYVDKFSGIVFTGKNGAQLFIPAAHHYTSDNAPCGVYWTSTPIDEENAYSFQFDNNRFYEGGGFNSYVKTKGCSILPIKRGSK